MGEYQVSSGSDGCDVDELSKRRRLRRNVGLGFMLGSPIAVALVSLVAFVLYPNGHRTVSSFQEWCSFWAVEGFSAAAYMLAWLAICVTLVLATSVSPTDLRNYSADSRAGVLILDDVTA